MHVSAWLRAAITRSVALVPTLIVALVYAGTTQMDALNQALNVVQSLQLPFALIPVLYITSREDIMGSTFVVQSTGRRPIICGLLSQQRTPWLRDNRACCKAAHFASPASTLPSLST
jgi:Mn2+/Fe2+ NRAMP family transporter